MAETSQTTQPNHHGDFPNPSTKPCPLVPRPKHLQSWGCPHLPEQPIPTLHGPLHGELLPNLHPHRPLVQLEAVSYQHTDPRPRCPQVYKRMKLQVVLSAVEMWTTKDHVVATQSLAQTLQSFSSWCQKDAAGRLSYDHVELLL